MLLGEPTEPVPAAATPFQSGIPGKPMNDPTLLRMNVSGKAFFKRCDPFHFTRHQDRSAAKTCGFVAWCENIVSIHRFPVQGSRLAIAFRSRVRRRGQSGGRKPR